MNGALYCAIGKKYYDMAVISAKQLRKTNKTLPIKLFTDVQHASKTYFDIIHEVPKGVPNRFVKLSVGKNMEFDNAIYLDVDTLVLDDISFIFSVLSNYDMAVCAAQKSRILFYANFIKNIHRNRDITHIAGGVYGFSKRISPWFFDKWLETYNKFISYTKLDQLSLSLTILDNGIKVYPLSSAWNVRPEWGDAVYGNIKILHSPKMLKDPSLCKYIKNKGTYDNCANPPRWVKN